MLTRVKGLVPAVAAALLLLATPAARAEPETAWSGIAAPLFEPVPLPAGVSRLVVGLAQDREGLIWLGTVGGLVRWDGHRTRVYKHDPDDPYSLPDNFVFATLVDRQGRLWVGTNGGGLARHDAATDRFVRIPSGPGGLPQAPIWDLREDRDGGIWAGTAKGAWRLDPATGAVTGLRAGPDGLPDDPVVMVRDGEAGDLWIGTSAGLARREAATGRVVTLESRGFGEAVPEIRSLLRDGAGRTWIGTRGHGLATLDPDGAVRRLSVAPELDGAWVEEIIEVTPGRFWLATNGQGLFEYRPGMPGQGRLRRFGHDPRQATSLADDSVWSVIRDRTGQLWIATQQGVSRFDPGQVSIASIMPGDDPRTTLADPDVRALAVDPAGRLWIGYRGAGLDIFDPKAGRVAQLRPDPARPTRSPPRSNKLSFAPAPGGGFLLGTDVGLYLVDAEAHGARRLELAGLDPVVEISSLHRDGGVLWIGTASSGLYRHVLGSGTAELAAGAGGPSGLSNPHVEIIVPIADGQFWIGTRDGLNRFDPARGVVERIGADRQDPASLANRQVVHALLDRKGRLWASVPGAGLDVLEGRDAAGRPIFRRIGLRDGLPNDRPNALALDGQGRVWLSSDDGLAVIDPDSFKVRTFGRADGYAAKSAWIRDVAVLPTGEIAFGGFGALTLVRPDATEAAPPVPSLVFTELRVGGRVLRGAKGLDAVDPVVVRPDANSLAVEFAGLDYAGTERLAYSYLLDGFDRYWTQVDSSRRVAAYTGLPPGDHVLRVRVADREGAWSDRESRLHVRVLPAWHQTLWFRALALLAAVGLVSAIVYARTRVLRRRERELAALVAQRTRELTESHLRLERIAFEDALTGLPNRRMFNDAVARLTSAAARRGAPLGLALIDVDRFKQVNDTLGHDAGDALLVEVANRLRAAMRGSDMVARLGGDEFAVLLPDLEAGEGVEVVGVRLQAAAADPVALPVGSHRVGLSIGIAVLPGGEVRPETLYKAADLALYEAKQAGRGTWRRYTGEKAALPA
ncbi:MAG TPA: diguanylate cyclase [Azospirillaceae bacterium]|nr:diguanylate cyclase [Azospirillaceae bacterium]